MRQSRGCPVIAGNPVAAQMGNMGKGTHADASDAAEVNILFPAGKKLGDFICSEMCVWQCHGGYLHAI
jgi:hypothetical protein